MSLAPKSTGTASAAHSKTNQVDPWAKLVCGLRKRIDEDLKRPELLARLSCEAAGLSHEDIAGLEAMAKANDTSLGAITWDAWRRARGSGFRSNFVRPEADDTTTTKRRRAPRKDLSK